MTDSATTLGQVILGARLRAKLTQAELANRLGLDAMTVSNWERGRQMPSQTSLRRLEQALGVQIPAELVARTPGRTGISSGSAIAGQLDAGNLPRTFRWLMDLLAALAKSGAKPKEVEATRALLLGPAASALYGMPDIPPTDEAVLPWVQAIGTAILKEVKRRHTG